MFEKMLCNLHNQYGNVMMIRKDNNQSSDYNERYTNNNDNNNKNNEQAVYGVANKRYCLVMSLCGLIIFKISAATEQLIVAPVGKAPFPFRGCHPFQIYWKDSGNKGRQK